MINYQQWEYHVEERVTNHEDLFNSLGRRGWEMVCSTNEFGKIRYVFKRQVPDTQDLINFAPAEAHFYNTFDGRFYKWGADSKAWVWDKVQMIWLNVVHLPSRGINAKLV